MSAIGPNTVPVDSASLLVTCRQPIAIGGPDIKLTSYFTAGVCRRIYMNSSGTLYVKGRDDPSFVAYTVLAGAYLDGIFTDIGGTGTGSTAMTVNAEL